MNFSQIITSIAAWMVARLNALKAKIALVETNLTTLSGTVTTLISTVTNGLADRYTKAETNQAIEGAITGVTDNLTDAYTAADTIVLNQAIAAARANVRKAFRHSITQSATVGLGDIVGSGLETGAYQVFFDGSSTVTGTAMLYNGAGAVYSQAVSNGDVYIFNVVDGVVTNGIFVNDEDNVKFNAIATEQATQDGRLDALEQSVADLDGDFATDADVDEKIRLAFDSLRAELYGSSYTDPN